MSIITHGSVLIKASKVDSHRVTQSEDAERALRDLQRHVETSYQFYSVFITGTCFFSPVLLSAAKRRYLHILCIYKNTFPPYRMT